MLLCDALYAWAHIPFRASQAQGELTLAVACSASNYLLGMTPLEIPAFMTGTVAGMTVWGCVYASIGGASRSLLKSGMDLEEVVSGKPTM